MVATRHNLLKLFPKHSVGAELGVLRGDFSQEMLDVVEPSLLYCIDCWGGIQPKVRRKRLEDLQFVMERFSSQIAKGQVKVIARMSEDAVRLVDDGTLDWIYIDANHRRNAVLFDLRSWYPKLRDGGIMSGHDYNEERYGVPWAVERFMPIIGKKLKDVNVTTKGLNDGGRGYTPSFWWKK